MNTSTSLSPDQQFISLLQLTSGQGINICSQSLDQILSTLDSHDIKQNTVVLLNGDVWRYGDRLAEISRHPKLSTKRVILQTPGYTNTKFDDRLYEISYPCWYWSREKLSKKFVPLDQNLKYGFSCLNNNNSIHRTLLGYHLYSNNLLSDMMFTQNLVNPFYTQRVFEDANELNLDLNIYQDYLKLLPIRHSSELNIDLNATITPITCQSIDHEAYHNAYCNILVESECEGYPYYQDINLPISTEKTYKPFRSKQVPLMLVARGHIKYLQGLGFELMTDLLPLGFDNMPVLQKIQEIVNIVKQGREFIKDFYFSHLREIQHNYELVNSDKVEKIILQRIESTLNE
jgi:hypothetical protein